MRSKLRPSQRLIVCFEQAERQGFTDIPHAMQSFVGRHEVYSESTMTILMLAYLYETRRNTLPLTWAGASRLIQQERKRFTNWLFNDPLPF